MKSPAAFRFSTAAGGGTLGICSRCKRELQLDGPSVAVELANSLTTRNAPQLIRELIGYDSPSYRFVEVRWRGGDVHLVAKLTA